MVRLIHKMWMINNFKFFWTTPSYTIIFRLFWNISFVHKKAHLYYGFVANEKFRRKEISLYFANFSQNFALFSRKWLKRKYFAKTISIEAVFCLFWWIFAFFFHEIYLLLISQNFHIFSHLFCEVFSFFISWKFRIFSRYRVKRNFAEEAKEMRQFFLFGANLNLYPCMDRLVPYTYRVWC